MFQGFQSPPDMLYISHPLPTSPLVHLFISAIGKLIYFSQHPDPQIDCRVAAIWGLENFRKILKPEFQNQKNNIRDFFPMKQLLVGVVMLYCSY